MSNQLTQHEQADAYKTSKRRQWIKFFRASYYLTSAPLHNLEVIKNGVECTETKPRDSLEHTVYVRNMENIIELFW